MPIIIPSMPTRVAAGAPGRVVVFARAPLPGRAKTRLIPALGAHGAARVHRQLVMRTLATVSSAAATREGAGVTLRVAPQVGHPLFERLRRAHGLRLRAQRGADLGQRMHHALAAELCACPAAVLVGSDCPGLRTDDISTALGALSDPAAGVDAVLGPALDGGYWLIGLRRPAMGLFQGVEWGSGHVAAQTRQRLRRLGWRWLELPARADLDRPADWLGSGFQPWRGGNALPAGRGDV